MTPHDLTGAQPSLFLAHRNDAGVAMVVGVLTPELVKDKALYGPEVVLESVVFHNRVEGVAVRLALFTGN